jgi:catechol 2,3-dioxygenase-like lactoylglutathione lyase family enzyme
VSTATLARGNPIDQLDRSGLIGKTSLTRLAGMTITQIRLMSLPVQDQDRARDFYVDVLGFEVVRDNPMGPDWRWVEVAPKGAQTSITLATWFPTMAPGFVKGLVLETDDIDGDVAAVTAAGVTIEGGIQEQPWGRFVTFNDPDGNGIVLQATAPNL